MMKQLGWLPVHPDLSRAVRSARGEVDAATRLRRAVAFAGYRRDFLLTGRIDQLASEALATLRKTGAPAVPDETGARPLLRPYRIALLASHTVDHLVSALRVAGLQRGLAIDVHVAAYGQYRQVLLGAEAALAAFAPQMVVLALDALDTPLRLPLATSEAAVTEAVQLRIGEFRRLWKRAAERFGATVVQQTFVATEPPLFGSFDLLVPGAPNSIVERLNAAMRLAAREDGVLLLDMVWCASLSGADVRLADPVRWHEAKQLVHPAAAPTYGEVLARLAAAAAGLSRKCLVLDLDNTLWGGVIGDDGLEALRLGQGDAVGEAFAAFQRYVAMLSQRGVILAVCSKNDLAVAEAGFGHVGMVLKRAEIAAFVANWEDKASNLRHIARTLQIGLDSLVFVDDNPAERDIVRRELPEVAVPEMSEDIADYPFILAAAGYFETVSFTQDDAARGQSYAMNAARHEALETATDLDGYLRSLGMRMTAVHVGPAELPRTVQLLNKTNQFNLTTRRYSEAEFSRLLARNGAQAWAFRLVDRFGDNGVISIVVLRPDETPDVAAPTGDALLIDSWVMSCRVLGRQVESAVLGVLLEAANRTGVSSLIGEFRPTARNDMVRAHYERLGFTPLPSRHGEDGATFWQHETARDRPVSPFIEVSQQ